VPALSHWTRPLPGKPRRIVRVSLDCMKPAILDFGYREIGKLP